MYVDTHARQLEKKKRRRKSRQGDFNATRSTQLPLPKEEIPSSRLPCRAPHQPTPGQIGAVKYQAFLMNRPGAFFALGIDDDSFDFGTMSPNLGPRYPTQHQLLRSLFTLDAILRTLGLNTIHSWELDSPKAEITKKMKALGLLPFSCPRYIFRGPCFVTIVCHI